VRRLLIILPLLLTLTCSAQDWQRIAIRSGLVFAGGFMDGTAESLRIHYSEFKQVHPKANDHFWNPSLSWVNNKINIKWKKKSQSF
jgi:uncharacterized protein (DUF952 family)